MMRTTLALFSLAIAAAVGGTVVLRSDDPATTAPPVAVLVSTAEPAAADIPDPGTEGDVTASDDAASAAVRVVGMTDELVTAGHFTRRDLVRSIATTDFAPTLIGDASAAIVDFQFEVDTAEGFWLLQQPLTVRSETVDVDRVQVEVWSVIVVASTEFGVGRESWQTSVLEMVSVDGVWLVDSWQSVPGPAPAPSADLVFASPLELGEAMSHPRVGVAG